MFHYGWIGAGAVGVCAVVLGAAFAGPGTAPDPDPVSAAAEAARAEPSAEAEGAPRTLTRVYVSMLPLPFDAYVERAHAIVLADLVPVGVVDADGILSTVYDARIEAAWKGDVDPSVRVLVGGGTLGDHATVVEGAPSFEPGEQVVLFLERMEGSDEWAVLGLSQGTLRVTRDAAGDRRVSGPFAADGPTLEVMRERVLALLQ